MTRNKKFIAILILSLAMVAVFGEGGSVRAQNPIRQINVPYTSATTNIPVPERAIFWFGQVDPTGNYVDVRTIYNDDKLIITAHIFDNKLWYDTTPNPSTLAQWDAVTLYLNTGGASGAMPISTSYKFVGQLNHWQSRADYQTAYRGDGTGWQSAAITFTTLSGWMGDYINNPNADDRGWNITFEIPFSSLGLSKPANGTEWGLAMVVHDRDDAAGTAIPDRVYPETFSDTRPETWATLRFGLPVYSPPLITPEGTTIVRQGLNGVTVSDAQVGGFSTCGEPFYQNFFDGWGNATETDYANFYNGTTNPHSQVNVQNQWNITDWPCFSKFYMRFPLNSVPAGKFIISATLTLYQFGNADPSQAEPSFIQVHSVGDGWDAATLSWNNAPLATENLGGSWVGVLQTQPPWPGVARQWNVSAAVAAAVQAGTPLNLALYSADNAMHSGKYFTASDIPDWDAEGRPTLTIRWGTLATVTSRVYLPLVLR